jgi:hypothetical protein
MILTMKMKPAALHGRIRAFLGGTAAIIVQDVPELRCQAKSEIQVGDSLEALREMSKKGAGTTRSGGKNEVDLLP